MSLETHRLVLERDEGCGCRACLLGRAEGLEIVAECEAGRVTKLS
jgi:hypothetical protein